MDLSFWDKYGKSIVAFLYLVATVVIAQWTGDHHIDPSEGIIIALAVGNNLVVYIVPLSKAFSGVKTIVNAVLAALAVAQVVIAGGIDANDWLLIVAAFLATVGVAFAPAASIKAGVRVDTGSDKALPV